MDFKLLPGKAEDKKAELMNKSVSLLSQFDMKRVHLTVNVASEETRETVMRCSELYGNIERLAERISPLRQLDTLGI